MTTKEIAAAILEAYEAHGYNCFGVRTGRPAEVGEELERSHVWDDNRPTDEELPGTCATGFGHLWFDGEVEDEEAIEKALEIHGGWEYAGGMTYVIGGRHAADGTDAHEVIISDAHVICIL